MKYMEFLEKVVKTINLKVDDDGLICYGVSDSELRPIKINDLPLALPTVDNIGNYFDIVDGNKKYYKVLFNPLKENVINTDNEHLLKLKNLIEQRIHYLIKVLGSCLLQTAKDQELQEESSILIEKYLTSIANIQTRGKKQVDDETLKNWARLCNRFDKVTIFLKKKGRINKEEFNRVAVLTHELYTELLNVSEEKAGKKHIDDIELRNRDVRLYIATIEFLLDLSDTAKLDGQSQMIQVGSKDKFTPAFHALYSLLLQILDRTDKIAKYFVNLEYFKDNEVLLKTYIEDRLDLVDLNKLDKYEIDVSEVPDNTNTSANTRGRLATNLPDYKKVESAIDPDEEDLTPTELMVKRMRESRGLPFVRQKESACPNTPENATLLVNQPYQQGFQPPIQQGYPQQYQQPMQYTPQQGYQPPMQQYNQYQQPYQPQYGYYQQPYQQPFQQVIQPVNQPFNQPYQQGFTTRVW